MAVELRNMLVKAVGRPLSATITFEYPSVIALVDHLAATVFVAELEVPTDTLSTPAVAVTPATSVLENLSADELAAQLLSRLDGIPIPKNS